VLLPSHRSRQALQAATPVTRLIGDPVICLKRFQEIGSSGFSVRPGSVMEQVLEDELLLEEAEFMGMRRLQPMPAEQDQVRHIGDRAFVQSVCAPASNLVLQSRLFRTRAARVSLSSFEGYAAIPCENASNCGMASVFPQRQ